ncbi:MAG: radical SAM/SPASM domain-containing protein [Saprospiraceae bacterium]|nr:radical SAM/SPASM domain-containing protein [Saprospiraceae bacterium]
MRLHTALRFLAILTPRRVLNVAKVLASYYWSKWTRRPVQWGWPLSVSIEPTTACNLRCPECPSGLRAFTRDTGNLKTDFFRKTVDELHRDLLFLLFYFQGEPYIHPQFLDMVAYARSRKIFTITSTNGHFLDDENARRTVESGLDQLIVSVDGATQETYEQYRIGGRLETVLQGVRRVVEWKKKLKSRYPQIILQMLVVRPNEHQINDLRRIARESGADELRLKSAQVYDYQQGNPLIPTRDRYARYRQLPDGEWVVKHALTPHCWKLWHACVITWDGMVVPCCFDKDAQHRLGDLKQASFHIIWHSPPYRAFRKAILQGRDQIDICRNCTEGCKVWV